MNRRGVWPGVLVVAALPTALFFSCLSPPWVGSARPWANADDFIGGLHCDMTQEEIAEHARSFSRLQLHHPDERQDLLVGRKGDTLIDLEIDRGRLQTYQVSWTSGFTKQTVELKTDLCSGQELVELHIIGGSEHAGTAVLLDGVRIGELPSHGTASFDVPLGAHTLALHRGNSIWTAELRYNRSSSGYDRLPIPESAFAAEQEVPDTSVNRSSLFLFEQIN